MATQHIYWKTGYEQSHPAYEHITPAYNDSRPRATIWVSKARKDIRVQQRPDLLNDPSGDTIVVEVQQTGQAPFSLINVYNEKPLDKTSTIYSLDRIDINNILLPKRRLLMGDMNAHDSVWKSDCQQNLRADRLIDLMERRGTD